MNSKDKFQPVKFHDIHGNNIILRKHKTVAHRTEGFNHGIVFTNRPLLIMEPITFQINEIANSWSGALRIGFTIHDPVGLRCKIPAHSCPDMVCISGNWAKAVPESVNKKNSILSFYVDANGDVYYTTGDEDNRFLLSGVDVSRKFWGVIDVYGNTEEIELLGSDCSDSEEDAGPPSAMIFHKIHGRTAGLKSDRTVATSKPRVPYYSYVFSNRPLKFNEKIVVQVLKLDRILRGPLEYGVTACDPECLLPNSLPSDAEDLLDWPDYWVLNQDSCDYKPGDILIFTISVDGKFLVLKNGSSRSAILHVDTSQPLWLFFKLSGAINSICMKGSFTKDYADIMRDYSSPSTSTVTVEPEKSSRRSGSLSENAIRECLICCDNLVNCALYRCGHMCMCYDCARNLWHPNAKVECPICRNPIQDVIKTYT